MRLYFFYHDIPTFALPYMCLQWHFSFLSRYEIKKCEQEIKGHRMSLEMQGFSTASQSPTDKSLPITHPILKVPQEKRLAFSMMGGILLRLTTGCKTGRSQPQIDSSIWGVP